MNAAPQDSQAPEPADRIIGFLRDIGITLEEAPVADDVFLPGIRIHAGGIVVDRQKLKWPGDLLHEAGHIAVTPAFARARLSDALADEHEHAHAGEMEATAWAYAATCALELDPAILFHDGGYHGHAAGLVATYQLGVYPGSQGLSLAGMTLLAPEAAKTGARPYPAMLRWLRE